MKNGIDIFETYSGLYVKKLVDKKTTLENAILPKRSIMSKLYNDFQDCESVEEVYAVAERAQKRLDARMEFVRRQTEEIKKKIDDFAEEYIDSRVGCG